MAAADSLSQVFNALADPTRRAILERLSRGEASVGELAARHDMSLAAVSKHITELEKAGLISRKKDAQYSYCTLAAGPFRDLQGWLNSYRRFWDANLDQFEAYLAALQRGDSDTKH